MVSVQWPVYAKMQRPYSGVNGNCFAFPSLDQQGTYEFSFRGPMCWNSDMALQKTIKFTERQNVQFRISALNFLNHPLTSFNSAEDGGRLNLFMAPTVQGLMDYTGYAGPFALHTASFGIPETKYGRRVVELTFSGTTSNVAPSERPPVGFLAGGLSYLCFRFGLRSARQLT